MFAAGSDVKYFVAASNEWNWGARTLWHREKAGTIEAVHDVWKNELARGAAVRPPITHNALTALKRIGLSEPWLRLRPKRLRFQIFCSPAKLVHHARQPRLRVHRAKGQLAEWIEVRRLPPVRACAAYGRTIRGDFPRTRISVDEQAGCLAIRSIPSRWR